MSFTLARRLVAECTATALLLVAIVGSGIMGERLAGGNVAIALLANTIATGAALCALILSFSGISGAHMNPAVTLVEAAMKRLSWRDVPVYILAQLLGAFAGVAIAHVMFQLPLFSASQHARSGATQVFAEFIASFGLLSVILGTSQQDAGQQRSVALAVAAYIMAAYWCTSSTSFANPAVTLARSVSDTFVGIRPQDAPGFILGQACGAASAAFLFRWLIRSERADTDGKR